MRAHRPQLTAHSVALVLLIAPCAHAAPDMSDAEDPEAPPERPPRSAWVEDVRVVRALKWGGAVLGGVLVLSLAGFFIRRAWKRRAPAALVAAAAAAPRRAPDAVAIEKLTALRNAGA